MNAQEILVIATVDAYHPLFQTMVSHAKHGLVMYPQNVALFAFKGLTPLHGIRGLHITKHYGLQRDPLFNYEADTFQLRLIVSAEHKHYERLSEFAATGFCTDNVEQVILNAIPDLMQFPAPMPQGLSLKVVYAPPEFCEVRRPKVCVGQIDKPLFF